MLDAGGIVDQIRSAMDGYGLQQWDVVIDPGMGAKLSVVGTRNRVKVRADAALSQDSVSRLVVHEVGGHVLRWENSRRQPERLAAVPLGSTVPTEEGLAALLEEEMALGDQASRHMYAVRVLGVMASRTMGLVELGFELTKYLPPPEAAELALRLRRGLTDPRSRGGPTKDHGYLTGLLYLRRLASDAPEDLRLLRAIKWPWETLNVARDLLFRGRLNYPELIPELNRLRIRSAGAELT